MYQQLGDAERVNEIIGMMQTVFDSEMPRSRTYDHDREILADVRRFAEGKYNLFPGSKYRKKEQMCIRDSSTDAGKYRSLEMAGGIYSFVENRDADGNARLHFIPVYVANGNYTVSVTATQIWTPAGMITAVRNSNTLTIDGTIYDDFYVGS